jgi:hypothetical protein
MICITLAEVVSFFNSKAAAFYGNQGKPRDIEHTLEKPMG